MAGLDAGVGSSSGSLCDMCFVVLAVVLLVPTRIIIRCDFESFCSSRRG